MIRPCYHLEHAQYNRDPTERRKTTKKFQEEKRHDDDLG